MYDMDAIDVSNSSAQSLPLMTSKILLSWICSQLTRFLSPALGLLCFDLRGGSNTGAAEPLMHFHTSLANALEDEAGRMLPGDDG